MQPSFSLIVNRANEYRVARPEDTEALCKYLAELSVFTAHVLGEHGEAGPTLNVIVESGRAIVEFHDFGRGIKLVSRDTACTQRGVVSLRNADFPDLELDQVEVYRRDLISPERAIAILRHFLNTAEVTDLVPWPPDDWDEWGATEIVSDPPEEEIPF
jgi:hypothetical protein